MSAPDPKRRLIAFASAMAVLVVTPLAVVASDRFSDVPDSNIFHADIQWMAEADVTRGCNPPANDEFCPSDNVTREQMAAFMHRLATNRVVDAATAQEAGHATTADEADHAATADEADHAATADEANHAATADEADHAATADHATTAGDADTLDGKDGSAYVEKGEDDSVTAEMSIDEPGLAQATNFISATLTGTPTSLISADIDAPAAGYVLVHATWEASANHADGVEDIARFDVSDEDAVFPEADNTRNFIVPSGESAGTHAVVSATQRAFAIEAQGVHTFYLVGTAVTGSVAADDMVITLVYVPTAYGPIDATVSSSDSGPDASD